MTSSYDEHDVKGTAAAHAAGKPHGHMFNQKQPEPAPTAPTKPNADTNQFPKSGAQRGGSK